MKVSGNLAWKNLTIEVNDRNKKSKILRILDNVSGEAKAGRMNIIMGPSGSGKSTLINTLMGVVPRNFRTSGKVLLDGKDRTMEYKMLVGTCDQDDVFYEHHTAEDFLKFHAKGANRHLSDEQNEERINFLLKRLRLEGRRNTKVAKMSGGEKKRLILISELMTDKKIIFLDEPTSGLDSHLALDLISFLKEITVEKNLMMFVTIHQPSPTIVRMFDDFTFLAWGRVLYHGEYVKCEEYFKENGFIKPENITFTEYLFELTTEKSCFDEIVPNLDKVQSLLPEKAESPKNSSKSFYILETKMSFKVIWALFMRLASHYFRNILSIGLILFILCTLVVNFFVFICSKKLMLGGSNTTNSNKSIDKNAIAEGCLKLVVEMIFLSFSIINQRIFSYSLKNNRLINIEIRNNIYSPFELLFSISILVICIFLFVIIFYNILFSMLSVTFYLKIFLLFLPFVFIFLVMGCLFYYNLNFFAVSFSILLFYFPMLKNVIFGIRGEPYFKSLFSFDHEKYHAYLDFFSLFLAFFPQIAYTAFVSFQCNKFISQLEIFDYDAWKDKTLSNFFYRFIQVRDSYGDPGGVSKTTILASFIATVLLLFLMVWNAFYVLKRKYSQSYRYVLENK